MIAVTSITPPHPPFLTFALFVRLLNTTVIILEKANHLLTLKESADGAHVEKKKQVGRQTRAVDFIANGNAVSNNPR